MSLHNKNPEEESIDKFTVFIHLGLMIFGIAALLTGDLAHDYKKTDHSGFTIHGWTGISVAAFAALRIVTGLIGPKSGRFVQWMPFTRERLKSAVDDIRGLLKFRLPEHKTRQGLAAVVQTFGLLVFFGMAATGGCLYFFLEPGQKARGFVHSVKELHEVGMPLIILFLLLHAGAAVMHALNGRSFWRKMFFISDTMEDKEESGEALPETR